MRRYRILLAVLTISGLLVMISILAVQTGLMDSWARERIADSIADRISGRVHLAEARVSLLPPRILLKNLSISIEDDPNPVPAVQVAAATLDLWTPDLTGRRRALGRVRIDRLRLRIERADSGDFNLARLSLPAVPARDNNLQEPPMLIRLGIADLRVTDALIDYEGRPIHVDSSSGGVALELAFDSMANGYRGTFELTDFALTVGELDLAAVNASARIEYDRSSVRLRDIHFRSPGIEAQLDATVQARGPHEYEIDVNQFILDLDQIPAIDGASIIGRLEVSGHVNGQGTEFLFEGDGNSEELVINTQSVTDLHLELAADRDGIQVRNARWNYRSGAGQGEGRLFWSHDHSSEFRFRLTGINVVGLLSDLSWDFPLKDSRASAAGTARWAGLEFGQIDVAADASLTGRLGTTQAPLPIVATARVHLLGNRFVLTEAAVQSGGSTITGEGTADLDGALDLLWSVQADSGNEIVAAAREAFGIALPSRLQPQLKLPQGTHLTGRLLRQPGSSVRVSGRLQPTALDLETGLSGSLSGQFEWSDHRLVLTDVKLEGEDFSAAAELDWGFDPGSERRLSIELTAVPLRESIALVGDSGPPARGRVYGQVDAFERGENRSASGMIRVEDLRTDKMELGQLESRLRLDGNSLRLENLRLVGPTGRVSGRAAWNLDDYALDLVADFSQLVFERLPLPAERMGLEGTAEGRLDVRGIFPQLEGTLHWKASEAGLASQRLHGTTFDGVFSGGGIEFEFASRLFTQPFAGQGRIGLQAPFPVRAQISLNNARLLPLWALAGLSAPADLEGTLSGNLRIDGSLSQPETLDLAFDLKQLQLTHEAATVKLTSEQTLSLEGDRLTIPGLEVSDGSNRLKVAGSVQLAQPPVLQLRLDGEVDLAILSALLEQGRATGSLSVERLDVVGPLDSARLVGSASLVAGSLVHPDLPVALANIACQLRFTTSQLSIEEFEATTEYGRFYASGGVFLDGLSPERWQINAFGYGLTLEYPTDLQSRIDFDVDFSRSREAQLLSGVIYLRAADYQGEISIADLILAATQSRSIGPGVADAGQTVLDLEVEAYRTIHINNNLADVIASGDFRVRGTVDNPVVLGDITIEEGTLRLDLNEFAIARGAVRFDDPSRTHPVLDIEANTQVREYDVSVILKGPVEQLRATFRSDPPLSSAQVVGLLATGQTPEQFSGVSALNRSGTIAAYGAGSLLGKAVGQQLGQKTRLFGFDRFSVDPFIDAGERDPGARITLGKQITRDLGVTYITKLGGQLNRQAVVIQYRITDWLTGVGSGEQDGTVAIDFKIRKRF